MRTKEFSITNHLKINNYLITAREGFTVKLQTRE